MRVCDASTSISAEFGGIRDSCLEIYHLICKVDRLNIHVVSLPRTQLAAQQCEEVKYSRRIPTSKTLTNNSS